MSQKQEQEHIISGIAPDLLSVIVLGSGGPAAAGRASSGYLVLVDGEARFLVDAGSGIFTRLGEAEVNISRLDTVFLTHLHIDHAAELPPVFKARAMMSQEPIHFSVYGPLGSGVYPSTSQFVHLLFDPGGAFAYQKSFQTTETISVVDLPIDLDTPVREVYVHDNVIVQALATRHGDTPANAYRINYQGASIVFSGDFDPSSLPNLTRLAQGANLFICTCDVLDPPGTSAVLYALHTPPRQIGELAAAAGVQVLLLSHLSPPIVKAQDQVQQSICRAYKGEVQFATDLMHVKAKF
ncbi:MAG TPA: MBL fold metallo-hydrolase [Ktedonobacteraceae bacterium]